MQLHGKLAVVTGASSGIGEATARALAGKGARLALVARRAEKLREVADQIAAAGGEATVFPADVGNAEAVAQCTAAIRDGLGTPDVLVNNAGGGRWLPLEETSPDEARAMIEAPYLAAFYMTRAFLPQMVARGRGQVVNVTSPASFLVWPNACGYIAARQAVRGFSDALRTELKGTGVNVMLAVFGKVASPYWEHNPDSEEHLPKPLPWVMPTLTTDETAAAIVAGIERNKRQVVKPAIFRVLHLLYALFPRLTVRMLTSR